MLAIALNRNLYAPILRQQIPENRSILPADEGLSYKLAVIANRQGLPRQAKRAAMASGAPLPQFHLTPKVRVVVDAQQSNIRDPPPGDLGDQRPRWIPSGNLFVLEDNARSIHLISPASGWAWRRLADRRHVPRSVPEEAPRLGRTVSRPPSLEAISMALVRMGWPTSIACESRSGANLLHAEHVLERLAARAGLGRSLPRQ